MTSTLALQGEAARGDIQDVLVRRRSAQDVLLTAAVLALVLCYLLPLSGVVALSFLKPVPGIGNYGALLQNQTVRSVVGNTLWISALTVSITLILAYVTAYGLVQAGPFARKLMLACVLLPLWISVLVRNYAWIALLSPGGIANSILLGWGWLDHPLSLVRNTFGVVLGMVHYMLPYAILPIYAQMTRIDATLPRMARSLGASRLQAFVRVFLPLSRPGVAAAAFLVSIMSLGFYVTPAILGGGKTVMVAEFISVQVTETLRWDIATTLSTLLLVVTGGLVWRFSHLLDMATAKPVT
ncbi:ABC transporter permease [Bradyrhizobium sp. U87765 SZCCT0131]|uniref:ABC transporter permease n=1 Tax=unclassified Bradyrhizobium TaxID=2631580 RepID=UPI001BADFBBC|nr:MULTISPECIES: ABC transporter permease [unclassified Bradyrhizobium]MBR1221527.1 ABC transporter permease [Bradyrhizobium sp. U87765 SZCCT0131]MBR1264550.1 ABC transporter permease [Bradyrhizobium sp. U87765 SZCCT0134]MBR1304544.1 ABC transporter permease [Bradyrhizobium sp. U87765 SZCCT0110]MBR1322599.1 ABC transporter permease [Bradyrhizobium sp. U87765 SZCCT0109]MBR1346473.1 ABC transporter permease [Bradyrhizobium sp. U87765 SZCCT0048]